MAKFVIPVKQFRRFEDPFPRRRDGQFPPVKYRFYMRTSDIPEEFADWMGPNPRAQNMKSNVSKSIRTSLHSENPVFHLWNRGILFSADKVFYDNKTDTATIIFDDPKLNGNIDGGHTLKIILEEQEKARKANKDLPIQYVEIEVITGLTKPDDLAEARNNSIAVDKKSLAELRNSFVYIKDAIQNHAIDGEYYINRIEFAQNEMRGTGNSIDIREIIAILNMFNQILYPNTEKDNHPIQSFTGKEVSLNKFLQMGLPDKASDKERQEARDQELQNMSPIIPDIFELWDLIEHDFTSATIANRIRFGALPYSNYKGSGPDDIAGVSLFSNKPLRYTIPKGILYPLVGAFRGLVEQDEAGLYRWTTPPREVWEQRKVELASYVMDFSTDLKHNPNALGKSKSLWKTLLVTV